MSRLRVDFPDCSLPCMRSVVCVVSTAQRTPVDLVRQSEQLWTVHPHDPHGAAPRACCFTQVCRSVVGRRARSRDGDLLCPAQLPGAPHALATNGLIGINSHDVRGVSYQKESEINSIVLTVPALLRQPFYQQSTAVLSPFMRCGVQF